nr:tetratricopeptide repeat protein [Planctomycetota bacterium]
ALQPLLSAADVDPAVLLWAGSIADKAGDWERAEAYFREAAALDQGRGRQRQLARLHLASLLTRHRRSEEAKAVLREQLAADPGDEPARAMLEVLERAPGDPGAR